MTNEDKVMKKAVTGFRRSLVITVVIMVLLIGLSFTFFIVNSTQSQSSDLEEEKSVLIAKHEQTLVDVSSKITAIAIRLDDEDVEDRQQLVETKKEMEAHMESLEENLEEIKESTANDWHNLKHDAESDYQALKNKLEDLAEDIEDDLTEIENS